MLIPLGKNKGGYFGEKINIRSVLQQIEDVAAKHGWDKDEYFEKKGFKFLALTKKNPGALRNIYISTGMHGDEPAGPLAALRLLEENRWVKDANIYLCPCLNPVGFVEGTRHNEDGIDLNRDYRTRKTPEVQSHISWLEKQPDFDLSLCLHEDWESKGFYILCRYTENDMPRKIIESVRCIFPVDDSEKIEGFPAERGLVKPNVDIEKVQEWPEAFYLTRYKKGKHFTFETSSDFELESRVRALVTATHSACALI